MVDAFLENLLVGHWRCLSRAILWVVMLSVATISSANGQQPAAPAPSKADEAAATRQYAAAVALQNREVYDLAAEEWQTFIKNFPKDPRVDRGYHYLGICYLKSQQLEPALETFKKVLKDYPQFALLESTHLYLGVTQYNLGRAGKPEFLDQASQTFSGLIEEYPQGKNLPQARFYWGESLYARGKKEEAAAKYSQLIQSSPQHELVADATYALGVCQQELGKHDVANQTYGRFLKQFPNHKLATEVSMRQGETLLSLKRYPEAEKLFAAAAAAPKFAHADFATLQYGVSLSARGQYPQAIAAYATLIKNFPQSQYVSTAYLESGKCSYLAGDYAAARTALSQVAGAGGATGAEAVHWIARSHLKEQQPAEALKILESAAASAANTPFAVQLALDQADAAYEIPERRADAGKLYAAIATKHSKDPIAAQALYMAAFTALGQNQYQQALDQSSEFLKLHAGHALEPDVLYIAAESQMQLGAYAPADDLYRRLIAKHSNHPDAGQWLIRSILSLFLQKKYSETITAVEGALQAIKVPAQLAEAYYLAGSAQLELKQFEAATRSLSASLRADSKWRQADETLLALAHAFRQLNNLEQARAALTKLSEEFPQSPLLDRAQYRLGEYAYAAKDFSTAAAQYQTVLQKWPDGNLAPYALHGLGWSQLSQGDYTAAVKTLTDLIKRFPQHEMTPRGYYARALARQQLKEYAAAIEDVDAFLKTNPPGSDIADARYVLGICQAATEKRADAIATFQSILRDFPQYAGADKTLYELAWAYKDQGQNAEAADAFAKLSSQYGTSPLAAESLFQSGEFHYQQKDYLKAAQYYDNADNKAGVSELGEKALHKFGWCFYRMDRFEDGFKTFAHQRKKYPQGALLGDATFMQAECLFKLGRYQEALALYGEVKKPAGKEFPALALLHSGQAAAQLKEWDRSIALLDQLLREYPQSDYVGEAMYEQGWAAQNLGNLDKAISLYKAVTEKTDREVAARAWFMSGEIYFDKKDHKEAIRCFLKAAFGYNFPTWQANAHYEAGRCFEAIGKKEQAIQSYQEVTTKHPQSDKAKLAQQRLDALK